MNPGPMLPLIANNTLKNYQRKNVDPLSVIEQMIYDLLHSTGQDLQLPRGKGTRGLQGPIRRCLTSPTHPPSPIRIRKTATAPGSPYSFRIVGGFYYVPQNYEHSRNCETGPPAFRPYPRSLESLTICPIMTCVA